ncbi:MAG: 3-deoxy-8-phosphooctulonate synthase [Candidatus Desulfofervidaceae bacterium]|nr:3-deoxy-8-phosphooctulonate synthase [Candidatus Desulfofervidaceae bacterium]
MPKLVKVGPIKVGGNAPLVLIAGPCVIEEEEITYQIARFLKNLTNKLKIPFIFKSSYDKANRTSGHSYRGPGLKEGLRILKRIKEELHIPVISDVHCVTQVEPAAEVLDIIQIPAFLCRQTDLIKAVAKTGRPINVKKGQFLAPWDVKYIIEKITECDNENILLTERGTCFGYNNLVVDFRSLVIMRQFGYPVVFDATHSVQLPGAACGASGGQREFVPYLAKAAVAVGVDALFMEVHEVPDNALCDGPNSWPLSELESLLQEIKNISKVTQND